MNKGRNIFILLMCLLCVSILTFLSIFQGNNKSGVVDGVRYVFENETLVSFYDITSNDSDKVRMAMVYDDDRYWYLSIEGSEYLFLLNKDSSDIKAQKNGKDVFGGDAFSVYSKKLVSEILEYKSPKGEVSGISFVYNREDSVKLYSFYFKEKGKVETAIVSENNTNWYIDIMNYKYSYSVEKGTGKTVPVSSEKDVSGDAFDLYSEEFFKQMLMGKETLLKAWQAILVGAVCFIGGAIIMFAEELWHIVFRKGEEEIPAWKDMNCIKYTGGGVIAVGVVLLIIFIII